MSINHIKGKFPPAHYQRYSYNYNEKLAQGGEAYIYIGWL